MGRPLTNDDLNVIEETFKDMENLSTRQKILVFLPSIVITSWILYQYYQVTIHMIV